jgi:hypothetical protein
MSCCRLSNCNLNGFSNGGLNNTNNISPTDVLSANNVISTSQNNCNNNCVNENLLDALCKCIGRKCNCEFETCNGLESKCGVLERVGNDYILLRSVNNNRSMYCSICNLLFVTIMC